MRGRIGEIGRWWLAGMLVFLPFQQRLAAFDRLHRFSCLLRYLDEITVVVFVCLSFPLLRSGMRKSRLFLSPVLLAMVTVSAAGLLSGAVNGNSFPVTALGTFDYVKNFLPLFFCAAFFHRPSDFEKVFPLLLGAGVVLGAVAIGQELWALCFRYLLRFPFQSGLLYPFRTRFPVEESYEYVAFWRVGLYRAPSLMDHSNNLGLFSLLVLTIYLFSTRRVRPSVFLCLFAGVFVSVSRMVYTAFLLPAGIQISRGRRWLLAPTLLVVVLLVCMARIPESTILLRKKKQAWVFRTYARDKAVEIWKDHPLLGVGPGMFGGVVSILFQSPVYERYGFDPKWYKFMKPFRSLDQFWPQALAETGLVGTLAFLGMLAGLLVVFIRWRRREPDGGLRSPPTAFILATALILVYSLGSGLNLTPFLFTYSALAGIGLGHEGGAGQ